VSIIQEVKAVLIVIYTYITSGIRLVVYLILSIGFVLVFTKPDNRVLKNLFGNKFFCFLGCISYEIYLIHDYIGYEIINQLNRLGWQNEFNIVVPILVSVILAYIIHQVSKWGIKKIKKTYDKLIVERANINGC